MRRKILWTVMLAALLAGVLLALTAMASARHSPTGAVGAKARTAGAKSTAAGAKSAAHPSLMVKAHTIRASRPHSPGTILYDQYNNDSGAATSSQNFEPANDAFDDELADDFVVPAAANWAVRSMDVAGQYFYGPGPADRFHVVFYADTGSGLPGTVVATRTVMGYTDTAG